MIGIFGCLVLAFTNYVLGTEFNLPQSFSNIAVAHLILSWAFFRINLLARARRRG
jgi:ABC-type spermidine/putrescine transport system permease subunit II